MAEERAERFHPEDVTEEVRRRLLEEAKQRGDFSKVHPCPASYNEVVDEPEAKLVILGPDSPHSAKDTDSPARQPLTHNLEMRIAAIEERLAAGGINLISWEHSP
jgi:hypothetical protein